MVEKEYSGLAFKDFEDSMTCMSKYRKRPIPIPPVRRRYISKILIKIEDLPYWKAAKTCKERGTPVFMEKMKMDFYANVEKTDLCWEWKGKMASKGYGRYKSFRAHRIAFFLEYKRLNKSLLICHRCDNPGCVRTDHLFEGTPKDNSMDAMAKGRINLEKIKEYWPKKGTKKSELAFSQRADSQC